MRCKVKLALMVTLVGSSSCRPANTDGQMPVRTADVASSAANDLRGAYRSDRGLGHTVLTLGDADMYRLQVFGDIGCIAEAKGRYVAIETGIELLPAAVVPREAVFYKSYVKVSWGDRAYLVPPERMDKFCSAAAEGLATRTESPFLLREGDSEKAVFGLPQVPAAWREKLHGRP